MLSSTLSSTEVKATMDLFDHRYYKLNKMFLLLLGQWPYQSKRVRLVMLVFIFIASLTQVVPQTMAIVKYRNDWNNLIDCAAPLTFTCFCFIKMFFSTFNSRKMLKLLKHMREDWNALAGDHDIDILHKYAMRGRMLTILYTVAGYGGCIFFLIEPLVAMIIKNRLRNGTNEPAELPIPLDYAHLIDIQKYYFHLVGFLCVIVCTAFLIMAAYDTLFMVCVQHSCGLYATLGRKLQRIGKKYKFEKTTDVVHVFNDLDTDSNDFATFINRHREAIEYAELIEATYSNSFLWLIGLNMLLISVTGYQIVTRTMGPQDTIRFVTSNVNAMGHLFIENYMGQLLMDHSVSIRYKIFTSDWYKISIEDQKILLFMIMRSNGPSKLTAGKIFTMSIETFETVLKTSISYFTMLRSV